MNPIERTSTQMSQPFKPNTDSRENLNKNSAQVIHDNSPQQTGTPAMRQSDARALRKAVKGDGFHELQNPSGLKSWHGIEPDEVLHKDIPEGSYSAQELARRHKNREDAHNALILARARHTTDASDPNPKAVFGDKQGFGGKK